MIQMDQHYIVTASAAGVVEGDRADVLGVWVFQALGTTPPNYASMQAE